ncbi:MAG: hypothetical protein JJE02_06275 [Propionibacteriales bacterium]|nr:hypothetical protein [Propionibacteriales bacterium]
MIRTVKITAFVIAACLLAGLSACGGESDAELDDRPAEQTAEQAADCWPARTLPVGNSSHTGLFDGNIRQYLLHVPPDYDGTEETPVVFAFHGLGGSADVLVAYTGWAAKADDDDFIVVAPQGLGPVPYWDFVTPASEKGSDLAFVKELTEQINNSACTDEDRVFATGFSNGSALTFALACSGDFDFAAYGAVAGAFYRPQCDSAPDASIIYFHGTSDPIVPFDGGPTPIADVDPVPETMAGWSAHNGCASKASVEAISSMVDEYVWGPCAPGVDLEAYVVKGGGHTWPGAEQLATLRSFGLTTDDINATELIWEFFKAHPHRG